MKTISSLLTGLLLVSVQSLAGVYPVQVNSAKLDSSGENLLLNISHSGGCGEHKYSLKSEFCMETYPVKCPVQVMDETDDMCEAYITKDISLNLAEAGFSGDYFSQATLIFNELVTVRLPSTLNVVDEK